MRPGIDEIGSWKRLAEIGGSVSVGLLLWLRAQGLRSARRRERRLSEELKAYAELEIHLPQNGDLRALSLRVCRLVEEKSSFYRVAMLVRDAQRRLYVGGSVGMDDATVKALAVWAREQTGTDRASSRQDSSLGQPVGSRSFAVALGGVEGGRAIAIPLRNGAGAEAGIAAGKMAGALVVCANGMLHVPRGLLDEALLPLETLAAKLGRTIENAALAERLLRAEKLAGMGMLADGIAYALNHPLTAVLGFAELIAGTTDEARVKTDAEVIVREALRMRATVDLLLDIGRSPVRKEMVDVAAMMRTLAAECRDELEKRGVRLVLKVPKLACFVHGDKDRLRQVMEHLLNNAAQAVASADVKEGHALELCLARDDRSVRIAVSDTGPGFRDPEQVFDPLSDPSSEAQRTGEGLGLGLCYGIVREHGGEISAVNLDPRGAEVLVEFPVADDDAAKVENVGYLLSD